MAKIPVELRLGNEDAELTKKLICENEMLLLKVEQLRHFVMGNGLEKVHLLREENDRLRLELSELQMRLETKDRHRDVTLNLLINQFYGINSGLQVLNAGMVKLQNPFDQTRLQNGVSEVEQGVKNSSNAKKLETVEKTFTEGSCLVSREPLRKKIMEPAIETKPLELRDVRTGNPAVLVSMNKQQEQLQLELFLAKQEIAARDLQLADAQNVEKTLRSEIERFRSHLTDMDASLVQERQKYNEIRSLYNNELANVAQLKAILGSVTAGMSETDLQLNKYRNLFQDFSFTNSDNKYAFQQTMEVQDRTLAELRSEVCAANCRFEDMKKYYEKRLGDEVNEKQNLLFRITELEDELRVAKECSKMSHRTAKA